MFVLSFFVNPRMELDIFIYFSRYPCTWGWSKDSKTSCVKQLNLPHLENLTSCLPFFIIIAHPNYRKSQVRWNHSFAPNRTCTVSVGTLWLCASGSITWHKTMTEQSLRTTEWTGSLYTQSTGSLSSMMILLSCACLNEYSSASGFALLALTLIVLSKAAPLLLDGVGLIMVGFLMIWKLFYKSYSDCGNLMVLKLFLSRFQQDWTWEEEPWCL